MAEFPRVFVSYVDDTKTVFPPERWPDARGDGVDEVYFEVGPDRGTRFNGHSLYWCRRVEGGWALGQGDVGGDPLRFEAVYYDDGTNESVKLEEFPDMEHSAVKLGWWRPGTEGMPE